MQNTDYVRIEKAILFLQSNFREQPRLREAAAEVGLSEFHFQRLFGRWAGISPKRFVQYLTAEHARTLLAQSRPVLEASFQSGLSGPGRLHDLLVAVDAVTPGEVGRQGEGLTIRYGVHPTPFGGCLLAVTERGICEMAFLPAGGPADALRRLRGRWARAEVREDAAATRPFIERVFAPGLASGGVPVPLHLRGTNFQVKVWEALLRIPSGAVATYQQVARAIGSPTAARAVGGAVARNPIAYLIPCHRVIRQSGAVGEYRWGAPRKQAILAWEAAHAERTAAEVGEPATGWNPAPLHP